MQADLQPISNYKINSTNELIVQRVQNLPAYNVITFDCQRNKYLVAGHNKTLFPSYWV